jgi:polysaccharide export outer membrane protein
MLPPREMSMRSLPAYRIEPPDVIQIEVLKLMPLPPYHIENYDVLQVRVNNALPDQPIFDYFIVDEGKINLGPAYGWVRVAGMTIDEATDVIRTHLQGILRQPEVAVTLARASGLQPVTGPYLVGPDGTVNLRQYGSVYVSGMTITEARLAIEEQLRNYLDSPEVSVDIGSYNSKTYYIITAGAGQGDNVVRVPVTGNETVLDAISQIQGLSQLSSKEIWIARPAPGEYGCQQILPVDWNAIVRGGMTGTNYQIMPGDRVFINEDPAIAATSLVGKLIGPFERALGFGSLGASTIRSFQLIGFRRTSF